MFAFFWFLSVAIVISTLLVWLLDNNGEVLVTWLGYELRTDVLTALLLSILFTAAVFLLSYVITRIFAIRFPNLLKLFFRKRYLRSLERLVRRHHQAFDVMTQLMFALEVGDINLARSLQKNFSHLVKQRTLNDFFSGKIAFENGDFAKSVELFSKFADDKNAKVLVLKSKLNLALRNNEETGVIAYAKQILAIKKDSIETAQTLFSFYKKCGMWREAKSLIAEYGSDKFKDELQKRDIAVINTALAFEAYKEKRFLSAIKHSGIALKAEDNFLPALEVQLRSWLKLGFSFKVLWKIKRLWRNNPHLALAEIFDLANRFSPAKTRIKQMQKLAKINDESGLGKLAVGIVAFRVADYKDAKDFLSLSLLRQKTHRAYKLLALSERRLGNEDEYKRNLTKAELIDKDDNYSCSSCGNLTPKWTAKCNSCESYDSLGWNS